MTQPFFYSKSSYCLPLPSSHHRRTLLAANDTLFVLIEEDDSNPHPDATLRVLPRQREGKSAGSRAPASGSEIAISREHLPLGWAGSTNAPCILTTSEAVPAFYILNQPKNLLIKVDIRLHLESTQLQVMQYNAGRTLSTLSPGWYEISALAMDADGVVPLFIKVLYNENGWYFIYFIRVILGVERRDTCEIETLLIRDSWQQWKNTKYTIGSDGKHRVAISSLHLIDVYDCLMYTQIYSISIPKAHRPLRPISVTFTMIYGEEWILCSEKMLGREERFDSGKQMAVRLGGQEQAWRQIVFPPTFCRDDAVNPVAIGRALYFASFNGIRVMNLGPSSLERIARVVCVDNTNKIIRMFHPCLVNYPVRLFYSVVSRMFINSGRSSMDVSEIAYELMMAAAVDKCELAEQKKKKKQLCESRLMDAVKCDNACRLLAVADMYGASRLKQHILQFILHRPTKHITTTAGWRYLLNSHPSLVTDIITHCEKVLFAGGIRHNDVSE